MVFTDDGRNAVRDWLAQETAATAPNNMLWGTTSESISETHSDMTGVVHGDTFVDTDISTTKQIQWEGIVLSVEATGSNIRQIGIGTETTGTAGTLYMIENVAPIVKTDQFDLQTFVIAEVE